MAAALLLLIAGADAPHAAEPAAANPLPAPWSLERARSWYDAQPWIVGANFVPSTASNPFEMWQADTFDPETINRELDWAAGLGFNTMRVFLHDMLWQADPEGFLKRIDQYLALADRHGIRTMFVLFDSVWDPHPAPGPQAAPRPGVHNSRWVQGPHIDVLRDPARHQEVRPYVVGVLTRYAHDERVLMWDLYNEPGNTNRITRGLEPPDKRDLCRIFLTSLIGWAREVNPSQPLTVGVWERLSGDPGQLDPIDHLMLDNSDIVSFHSYAPLERMKPTIDWLRGYGRPLVCTEYLSRTTRNTFQTILPFLREQRIGAINWGLVSGRSQTIYPWGSWLVPFKSEPHPWFHDILRADGTPYDETETELIRRLTGAAGGAP